MPTTLRKYWPALKWLFTIAVLAFVGRQFARDLTNAELWRRPIGYEWLVVAGGLYLAGLGMSAIFWLLLLRRLDQRPRTAAAVRAYYLGHFGKYIPGKALALVLRVGLARSAGVKVGVGILSTFYEVMITMTAGALTAAALFALLGLLGSAPFDLTGFRRLIHFEDITDGIDPRALSLLALGLAAIVGLPLLPPIFNRIVSRLAAPFRETSTTLPHVPIAALIEGLLLTTIGWCLHGVSLWAVLRSIDGVSFDLTWNIWSWCTAGLSLAYVLGFVVVLVPNGLGVREYFLTLTLAPILTTDVGDANEARAVAVLAVVLLRVVWMAAEVCLAPLLYWMPLKIIDPHENNVRLGGRG